mmetsp:Transcript_26085/g.61266  ORF Transcript_26085/g.61266 Transcript_26085/m.61266 type:complete len:200 (-) Transcript_26085:943-1542(-)
MYRGDPILAVMSKSASRRTGSMDASAVIPISKGTAGGSVFSASAVASPCGRLPRYFPLAFRRTWLSPVSEVDVRKGETLLELRLLAWLLLLSMSASKLLALVFLLSRPFLYGRSASAGSSGIRRAMSKSKIFRASGEPWCCFGLPPSLWSSSKVTPRLSGFRSRCMIRCLCRCLTVSESCRRMLARSESPAFGQRVVYG